MENTVRLTWAVPVSAVLLGARVEAYVESKATVSTFRLCAKYGNPIIAPVARLPTELINEILGYIGQSFFEGRLSDWENHIGCLKGYHCLDGGGEECRESHIPMIKGSLGGSDEEQRFGKIFTQDFGLAVYFDIFRKYDGEYYTEGHFTGAHFTEAIVFGYLTIPSAHWKIESSEGPVVVSYLASTIVDPSILSPLSAEEKARFEAAMKTLNLKVKTLVAAGPDPSQNGDPEQDNSIKYGTNEGEPQEDPSIAPRKGITSTVLNTKEWPKLMILSSGLLPSN